MPEIKLEYSEYQSVIDILKKECSKSDNLNTGVNYIFLKSQKH